MRLGLSGLYEWRYRRVIYPWPVRAELPVQTNPYTDPEFPPNPKASPGSEAIEDNLSAFFPWWFLREELRLDVDGSYPQMTASGTLFRGLNVRVHWIAKLASAGSYRWTGVIWYKDGDVSALPHTQVSIAATPPWFAYQRKVTVTFSGRGARPRTVSYIYKSHYFHQVEFEFDTVAGATAVTAIGTHDHPNRPAALPSENLTIEGVYRRTGFSVTRSGDNTVPLDLAEANARWSDAEMHDAMQIHWSRFADKPQWALWVFFAALHERGTGLGGIMFDDIGPNHRQGTAIFSDSFISQAPHDDANPGAWVARMRFWTAVHEMGHSFNLAHAWQKSHPSSWGTPWIPLTNDSEARSFMNYPYYVNGGQSAFFSDFEFRFIDEELLFMRHAPARFVQMGNADWFDNHGFEQAEVWPEPTFKLVARVNRPEPIFEFLEPVCIELKLTNVSGSIQLVDENALKGDHETTVIIKKDGKRARRWMPYATYCWKEKPQALLADKAIYDSLFVAAGLNGWDLSEPGNYTVQVAIRRGEEDIVSNPLRIQIKPPRGYDEEDLAQDLFSEDVGRTFAFDGTRATNLSHANDLLLKTVERLPDRRVAVHARVALAMPGLRPNKELDYVDDKPTIKTKKVETAAVDMLAPALSAETDTAAETLGHIDYKQYVDSFSSFLASTGDKSGAAKAQGVLHSTLSARGVLKDVLKNIRDAQKGYKP
jgi:hypothetical protein